MDDSISRQAALDALPKKQNGIGGESWMKTYRRSGYNDCVEDCMKALQALPSAQPGWIPVTEKLPTENNSYLVWMPFAPEGHHITVAEWCGSYWNIKTPITAWMPLPQPWEGGQDD